MDAPKLHIRFRAFFMIIIGVLAGLVTGWLAPPAILSSCTLVADIFVRLLKLVSLPIVFFSLLTTLSGMKREGETQFIAGRLFFYTFMTTLLAAVVALLLYLWFAPASNSLTVVDTSDPSIEKAAFSFQTYLVNLVPANVFQPFIEGSVVSVLMLAIAIGLGTRALVDDKRAVLHELFTALFSVIMKLTTAILMLMPIAIWAFVAIIVQDMKAQPAVSEMGTYLFCLLLANSIQAFIVLPLFLKWKGISPWATFKGVSPALLVAFLSKSSSATLPTVMACVQNRLGVQKSIAHLSLPLCITINMNACAAFILITVLFVSQSHGMNYTMAELVLWVFIATFSAIGNAGVPMGCYMLSSALLVTMGVPLHMMMVILPFYALIDMFESAINIWSDSCVTTAVDRDFQLSSRSVPSIDRI
ncbi:Proton/sodium-glutamate symport protein [invertebrate metagenome]|uniref:Proton/sodium-glutamate symport protein n=1 Tax=invertebrate metagenome TaxID=1711999 RepID=A0A2H9TC93_9ZZZZ